MEIVEIAKYVATHLNSGFCIEDKKTKETLKGIIFSSDCGASEIRYCSSLEGSKWYSLTAEDNGKAVNKLLTKALEFVDGNNLSDVKLGQLDEKELLIQQKFFQLKLKNDKGKLENTSKENKEAEKLDRPTRGIEVGDMRAKMAAVRNNSNG